MRGYRPGKTGGVLVSHAREKYRQCIQKESGLAYNRQPDDYVPEIAITAANRKVAKPTDQLREWKFFGKDHAGMRSADFLPVGRKG
jgi:hypothetical protein